MLSEIGDESTYQGDLFAAQSGTDNTMKVWMPDMEKELLDWVRIVQGILGKCDKKIQHQNTERILINYQSVDEYIFKYIFNRKVYI